MKLIDFSGKFFGLIKFDYQTVQVVTMGNIVSTQKISKKIIINFQSLLNQYFCVISVTS